jgi:hypothetical protein
VSARKRSGYVRITPWSIGAMVVALVLCSTLGGAVVVLTVFLLWAVTRGRSS